MYYDKLVFLIYVFLISLPFLRKFYVDPVNVNGKNTLCCCLSCLCGMRHVTVMVYATPFVGNIRELIKALNKRYHVYNK